jgi:RHS repeat-associated protein
VASWISCSSLEAADFTESNASGVINGEYVFFGGVRIDRPSGETHYYFSDHLGSASVVAAVGSTTPEEESDYYLFGGERPIIIGPNTYKFTGKERDGESGLDYFGARYFSSALARFIRPDDPLVDQEAFNPQSWNLYTYVRNNPLSFSDPTGNACVGDGNGGYKDDSRGGESCSEVDQNEAEREPSATVTASYTQEDRIQILANDVSDFTSLSSITEVGRNGLEGAMALEGIYELPGAVRAARSWLQAWKLATRMRSVRATGDFGEALAGIIKNTERIESSTGTAAYRVPDILDKSAQIIGEVKNIPGKQALTSQIRDGVAYAQREGYHYVLYVRNSTSFTRPLQQLVDKGVITVVRF